MRVLSKKKNFDCDHSSVNYEFVSEERISKQAREFAKKSSYRFKVSNNKLKIHIPGENYLYDHIQDTLLEKYNIPLLIYEDYDWWNFLLMFDYNKELMVNLKEYKAGIDHTIDVTKKSKKIELWITVHLDYNHFDDESPFEELGEMFLDIRKEILENNFESLKILKKYCNNENLSEFKPSSELCRQLVLVLDKHWG